MGDAIIHMHGVGGRTVKKLRDYDLGLVSSLKPHAVILEIGTNDLANLGPEVIRSEIEELTKGSYYVRLGLGGGLQCLFQIHIMFTHTNPGIGSTTVGKKHCH